jgi:hypothetical protein
VAGTEIFAFVRTIPHTYSIAKIIGKIQRGDLHYTSIRTSGQLMNILDTLFQVHHSCTRLQGSCHLPAVRQKRLSYFRTFNELALEFE